MRLNVRDARNRFSELIQAVENGEEVTILKHGRAVAQIIRPTETRKRGPRLGTLAGARVIVDPNWRSGPETTEEVDAWAGRTVRVGAGFARCSSLHSAATERSSENPRRPVRVLLRDESKRFLSAMSLAELAIKTSIGKLNLTAEQARTAPGDLKLR